MTLKYLLRTLLLTFLTTSAFAQTDTEFWFVAPEVSADHGDRPVLLRLSTIHQASHIRVSQPANPDFVPVLLFLEANSTETINLTGMINMLENQPANKVLNKGLFIQATEPIAAYYEVADGVNPEIFPLKGENALGVKFYTPSQNFYYNQNGSEAIDIVATEDNTTITITPTDAVVGHPSQAPFTIMLNRGETYSARATNTSAPATLGGTLIQANKPIAVTISDDSIRDRDFWDLIGDQLIPVNYLGTEYIVVKGYATTELVFVVATEDGTKVVASGSTTSTEILSAGQMASFTISSGAMYIKSDKPIYVRQITGHGGELGDAVIPPIGCTGSGQVGFVRTTSQDFVLMLLTQAGNQDHFVMNDNTSLIAGSSFRSVPGNADWVFALLPMSTFQVPLGANLIRNTKGFFHMGILHQLGPSSVYGYFSNYNEYAGSNITLCPGGTTTIDPGPQFDTYLWSDGSTGQTFAVDQEGIYTLTVSFSNGCVATDTFNVFFAPTQVTLGNDTLLCEGNEIILEAEEEFDTYEWKNLSGTLLGKTPGLKVKEAATYIVNTSNPCGAFSDSVIIDFTPRPVLELGPDQIVCDEEKITLDAGEGFDTYLWENGSQEQFITASATGIYQVTATKAACTLSDVIDIKFSRTPLPFDLGEDRTICVNEETLLEIRGNDYEQYVWFDSTQEAQLTVTGEGTYWAIASNDCGEVQDEITLTAIRFEDLYIPNVFTPNGDDDNETFVLDEWLSGAQLWVYNRWGKQVFSSLSYQNNWHGEALETGIYYYEIKSECLDDAFKGWLHLLR